MSARARSARRGWAAAAVAALAVAGGTPAVARAQVPTPATEMATPAGPLVRIVLGNELSCQVAHAADRLMEVYPPSAAPGSCGTLLTAGTTLFAPDFANHAGSATGSLGATTPFTPVSQTPASGAGTAADPRTVRTVADAGASGLRVTQVDTYIAGQEAYRTDVTVENRGGGPASGVLYRAADCYLQESDTGFGFVDPAAGAAGCSLNANNTPAARIEQWYPLTRGARYMEAGYSEVWAHIATRTPFPNTCRCGESVDNGAGISWTYALAPGERATFSHVTVFSPTGAAGLPQGTSTTAPSRSQPVFGRGGLVTAPSNRRCLSRRSFRIRLRHPTGTRIAAAIVRVNGQTVRTLRGTRVTAPVNLTGLPRGRYTVTIRMLLDDGRVLTGTRRYRTCAPRRGSGNRRPPPV